ncbi:MAG: DNA-formamidopyrimidine glycosylase [Polyangiaceae bacterium UTPRO1]|nr:bifunctional DNA-formamidopyrimidine glycosylase/DNA-(apurinic or apyrimidinic site) lyase [Myxococcales bacterium]OQY65652.1 MAG: DNA-formamidopyrimidine glycosylase [Polyangiaceae bacterium UTPRO1]
MPELPEVETVRRGLADAVAGRRITVVEVHERRLRRPLARDFAARLAGRRIEGVRRRAKYLLLDLDDGASWLVHLGMTGTMVVRPADEPRRVHTHVVVQLDDGRTLRFHDPRRFGSMQIGAADALAPLATLGPEPLTAGFSGESFHGVARRQRRTVKSLLMDQRVVAGLGNIYVNEILFAAGIRPSRRASRVTRADAERIVAETRRVLAAAIELRGSSISDYRDERGEPGAFQLTFRVYERAGEPCRRCRGVIRRCVIAGRSSFYCSRCQR